MNSAKRTSVQEDEREHVECCAVIRRNKQRRLNNARQCAAKASKRRTCLSAWLSDACPVLLFERTTKPKNSATNRAAGAQTVSQILAKQRAHRVAEERRSDSAPRAKIARSKTPCLDAATVNALESTSYSHSSGRRRARVRQAGTRAG